MKIKQILLLPIFMISLNIGAQISKKAFTLNDLIPGGDNFWNLQPTYKYYTFWGENPLELKDTLIEENLLTSKRTTPLLLLQEVNEAINDKNDKVSHFYNASFPYAQLPLVKLSSYKKHFLYNFKTKKIVWSQPRLNAEAEDWNANTKSTAYVKDHNLYVIDAEGKTFQISKDGSRNLVYGKSVHRDEFGIHKGTFWSPSGKALAFYKMDQSMVADYPQVDIFTRIATYVPEKYPMAGEKSHKVYIGIFRPNKEVLYLKTGDPTNRYFTNIAWSPDEKTIYVIELPRSQDKAELVAYDAFTGERKDILYTETNEKYVEPQHPIVFLPWDSNLCLYQSQKDGYNHFYLLNIQTKQMKQLTKGFFVVKDFLGFDIEKKKVLFTSTESSPIQYNTYAVDVNTQKRILLDNGKGVHRPILSAKGSFILDKYTTPTTPRNYALIDTRKAKSYPLFEAKSKWNDYEVAEISSGTIKAADKSTNLYYRLLKPTNFNPNKKYPAVVYVYGGPHARNVTAEYQYGARGWEFYMAQKGYVVFVLDNRGSEDRGFAFESVTYRQLGTEEMKDQVEGVKFLQSLPYVNQDKIGVHGWSFGGFMTTNLMLTYPDIFKVGVAGGPVIDWKYYEVMYGERYMDTPQENPEGYAKANLNARAKNLKGHLQIIHGYNDPVCLPQHPLSFFKATIDAGTQVDAFFYPGAGHNMSGKDRVHLHERITQYFETYLK